MSGLYDHPGYLGFGSVKGILIHADWPVYAVEDGYQYALWTLGQFLRGTVFHKIDDIDKCFLFLVGKDPTCVDDVYDESELHAAVWYDDILDLADRGYVTGVRRVTEREWVAQGWQDTLDACGGHPGYTASDGTFYLVPAPDLDKYDDELDLYPVLDSGRVSLTAPAFVELREMMAEDRDRIHADVRRQVDDLIALGKYDTAVRDACVLLETRLKEVTGTTLYGQRLVERFYSDLAAQDCYIASRLKTLRTELRTVFMFVRNEYAHNLKQITEEQCLAIVLRISLVYADLEEL